jgi:hypothetical protein
MAHQRMIAQPRGKDRAEETLQVETQAAADARATEIIIRSTAAR